MIIFLKKVGDGATHLKNGVLPTQGKKRSSLNCKSMMIVAVLNMKPEILYTVTAPKSLNVSLASCCPPLVRKW
jgi:hypothetical protein